MSASKETHDAFFSSGTTHNLIVLYVKTPLSIGKNRNISNSRVSRHELSLTNKCKVRTKPTLKKKV